MIGLDTNVVLRYLLQDDPDQSVLVNRIFERRISASDPGFINVAVMLEIVWVLRSVFKQTPIQIAACLEALLTADSLTIQNEQQVFEAAFALKRGTAEFEDALIGALNAHSGCGHTLTFDRRAVRVAGLKAIG
ncbi:PIN domain-containing protein [Granulicella aggregans]|uniref:PIN domain-containing protein n=1 Tax=Granulicella aggregans TaxID=474949 RepID=UPI0021DF46BC|nr:type II toxin-antitoxin system VapC family toxin [Granulicella aggregans]